MINQLIDSFISPRELRSMTLILIMLTAICLSALSNADLKFLTEKEQFNLLKKHEAEIIRKAETGDQTDLKSVLDYAERSDYPDLATLCHKRLALKTNSLEDALQWLLLMKSSEADSLEIQSGIDQMLKVFTSPLDQILLLHYTYGGLEDELATLVSGSLDYNTVIEASAKELIDEISTTREDSLALSQITNFRNVYPKSKYAHIAQYYAYYHLSNINNWQAMLDEAKASSIADPVQCYISALYLVSPTLRKNVQNSGELLDLASSLLIKAESDKGQSLLYEEYTSQDWQARIELQKAKLIYYRLLEQNHLFGDEDKLINLKSLPSKQYKALLKNLNIIEFSSNDRGEQAELHFWIAKVLMLSSKKSNHLKAAKHLTKCLILGAPRKKYDDDALNLITVLQKDLKINSSPLEWMRKLMNYRSICFEDYTATSGLTGKSYTRVALADFDNSGATDLLFNGRYLFRNDGNFNFSDVTESAGLDKLNSAGGIFADFNRDGLLDFVAYGHSEDGNGDLLMKNMDNSRFVNVNERAGDIDDKSPTEAAAWIDEKSDGYPSLYSANYEKWQVQSGYPDFYWRNDKGYFSDRSNFLGFRSPDYTVNPGLAGRGVSPADFDNDGKQEILVSNYRLNRNFCWKQNDSIYVDVAALDGLAGTYKKGYFGHTIGVDWGDFDNDGDLDLFVANLAHPRFLDISDVSMLLRNDGLTYRVVEQDTVFYWQFTDVTKSAGITFDELHSDPLFFDADNDGWLDLFITSVYVGERSYLYRNKGDGSFEDITWLAGARVYNGWGNANADLNRDGLPDLVVGSGNGVKLLKNSTKTDNRSITVKPIWKGDTIELETEPSNYPKLPNSPAFGTRVEVTVLDSNGKPRKLIRELSSAKGTGSQNVPELHFGIGRGKVIDLKRITP